MKLFTSIRNSGQRLVMMLTAFCATLFFSAVATAAPDAAAINTESMDIVSLILGILEGPTGWLFTLIAFLAGIFFYFSKRDIWATMGCFALALMIVIVPNALGGFFQAV